MSNVVSELYYIYTQLICSLDIKKLALGLFTHIQIVLISFLLLCALRFQSKYLTYQDLIKLKTDI